MDRNGNDHSEIVRLESFSPTYHNMVLVGNSFYLTGSPAEFFASGIRMLRSDGTAGGTIVLDEDVGTRTAGSYPQHFKHYNGRVFFRTNHSYYQQHDLWVTDGTPGGTLEFSNYPEEVDQMELVGSTLFASIFQSFGLFKTDMNTGGGEYLLPGDYPKPIIKFMTQANGLLYFSNGDGGELWTSDGSADGTTQLKTFHRVIALDAVGGRVMFRAILENGAEELWRSNGTVSGTVKIKTLRTGGSSGVAGPSAVMGTTYYFVANDGVHGRELWKSAGTAAGTQMVADLNTNDPGDTDDIRHLFSYKNSLFISAMGNDGKWGLYKTNGTASGTHFIQHLGPITTSVATSDKVYMFTLAPDGRPTLWTTDGSADGTQLVKALTGAFTDLSHEVIGDVLFFSINENGALWRTDGTECGTFTINIGSKGASPMIALNNTLIFGSGDSQAGYEPHAFNTTGAPGNPCGEIAAAKIEDAMQAEEILSGYPNPFTNDFALRIEGEEAERASVQVFTLYGQPIEDLGVVTSNSDYRIGQSWAPGIYVIHVAKGHKMIRLMVVKE